MAPSNETPGADSRVVKVPRGVIKASECSGRCLLPVQPQTFNLAGLHSSTGGVVRQVERHGPPATVEHVVKGGGVTAEDDLALAGAEYYERVEDERPVIVLDFQKQTICAYHYEEYRVILSKESQVVLDEEYEKALAEDKVLVLAWDSATGRLVTTTFDLD